MRMFFQTELQLPLDSDQRDPIRLIALIFTLSKWNQISVNGHTCELGQRQTWLAFFCGNPVGLLLNTNTFCNYG